MNLTKVIDTFISQYGRIFRINDYTGKCILSTKGGQNTDFLSKEIDRLSSNIVGNFIMFCVATAIISVENTVEISGIQYSINAVEDYYICDRPIYKWAILERQMI